MPALTCSAPSERSLELYCDVPPFAVEPIPAIITDAIENGRLQLVDIAGGAETEHHLLARKMQCRYSANALDAPMPFCDIAKALVSQFAVAFVHHPRDAIATVGILPGDAILFSEVSEHAAHVPTT